MRVYIIDDAPFIREILKNCLSRMGHEVVGESSDPEIGMDEILNLIPDLVFVDLVLPRANGIEVAQHLLSKNSQIHLIAISSLDKKLVFEKCLSAGFLGFLQKPFDEVEVEKVINQVFHKEESFL
jgi:DNA-binding NarL/FixJ family response regulator